MADVALPVRMYPFEPVIRRSRRRRALLASTQVVSIPRSRTITVEPIVLRFYTSTVDTEAEEAPVVSVRRPGGHTAGGRRIRAFGDVRARVRPRR